MEHHPLIDRKNPVMISDLRASLYDFFGYLLPGMIATAGIGVLLTSATDLNAAIPIGLLRDGLIGIGFLVTSYCVGHLIHAIGNVLPPIRYTPEEELLGKNGSLSLELRNALDDALRRRLRLDPEKLEPGEKYAVADEARALVPREGDRDMYIYREGFYRGMTIASAIIALALLWRGVFAETCISVNPDQVWCVARRVWITMGVGAVFAVFGFGYRMRRFARYRVNRAVMLGLIALSESK